LSGLAYICVMDMIKRVLIDELRRDLAETNKIIVLYGPRQVGKTTIIKELIGQLPYKSLMLNGDDASAREYFTGRDLQRMKALVGGHDLVFIDEAQRIPDIGMHLKILYDSMPSLKIIATGSSSFDLANKINEPLTGRKWVHQLYPISILELSDTLSPFELNQQLPSLLTFGMYPDVLNQPNEARKIRSIEEIATSYLYKDILEISSIKFPEKLGKLLKLLAYQIGRPVSVQELSRQLAMSAEAVENYIDLLEKGFIIFRLTAYSTNPRKEIIRMQKIYFYDIGIRNAIIKDYNDPELRLDLGHIWENFLIAERMKVNSYNLKSPFTHFWKSKGNVEVDYVEIWNQVMVGYEFKWSEKKIKIPQVWSELYPDAVLHRIDRYNFLDFVL
jgi:uncharacterized protein